MHTYIHTYLSVAFKSILLQVTYETHHIPSLPAKTIQITITLYCNRQCFRVKVKLPALSLLL